MIHSDRVRLDIETRLVGDVPDERIQNASSQAKVETFWET